MLTIVTGSTEGLSQALQRLLFRGQPGGGGVHKMRENGPRALLCILAEKQRRLFHGRK